MVHPLRLLMSLKSDLVYEIRYALDILVIQSAENALSFKQYPFLMDGLLDLFSSTVSKLLSEPAPGTVFLSYKDLFGLAQDAAFSFVTDADQTFNEKAILEERALSIGLILRNSSFHPDNQPIYANSEMIHNFLYWTLNVNIGKDSECALFNLEHRKNAIIVLSNIASGLIIKCQAFADLILGCCTDFVMESHTPYPFPAMEIIAKLMLIQANQQYFVQKDLGPFIQGVISHLPHFFQVDSKPESVALWELCMVNIISLVILCDQVKSGFVEKYGLHMLQLCRKPIHPSNPQLAGIFDTHRERAIKTLVECSAQLDLKFEKKLMDLVYYCLKNGDQWMAVIVSTLLAEMATNK